MQNERLLGENILWLQALRDTTFPSGKRKSRYSGRVSRENSLSTSFTRSFVISAKSFPSAYAAQSRPCTMKQSFSPRFTRKVSLFMRVPPEIR